jgi:hypothetical protein
MASLGGEASPSSLRLLPRLERKEPMIWRLLVGVAVGGALGYANYCFMGCPTGTCPLSSNPWTSTVIGVLFGLMIAARCCGACKVKRG